MSFPKRFAIHFAGVAIAAAIQAFIEFTVTPGTPSTDGEALVQGSLSGFLVIALYWFFGFFLPRCIIKAKSPQNALKLRLGIVCDKAEKSAPAEPSLPRGVRIAQVLCDSAAAKAEIRENMLICSINGRTVENAAEAELVADAFADKSNWTVVIADPAQNYEETTYRIRFITEKNG